MVFRTNKNYALSVFFSLKLLLCLAIYMIIFFYNVIIRTVLTIVSITVIVHHLNLLNVSWIILFKNQPNLKIFE